MSKNPLEIAYKNLDLIEQQISNKVADIKFGMMSEKQTALAFEQLRVLNLQKQVAQASLKNAQTFLIRKVDIQSGKLSVILRTHPRYGYFHTTLKKEDFMYSQTGEPCDFCGKTDSARTAVVFTVDPVTGELFYMCDYCHIDRSRMAQRSTQE